MQGSRIRILDVGDEVSCPVSNIGISDSHDGCDKFKRKTCIKDSWDSAEQQQQVLDACLVDTSSQTDGELYREIPFFRVAGTRCGSQQEAVMVS